MIAEDQIQEERAIRWAQKDALAGLVRERVLPAEIVMDVGCGIQPQTLVWPRVHLCVEIYEEYVNYLRARVAGSTRFVVIHSAWQEALRIMSPKSVDTVFALDFIEHLPQAEGYDFLEQACRIARRQVVVFTPLGYFPQSYESADEKDRWGMHGGRWQTHRSGWTPADFSSEWEIIACRDYHTNDQNGPLDEPIGCMWAIRTLQEPPAEPFRVHGWEQQLWRRTMIHRHFPSWCLMALRRARRIRSKAS